MIPIEHEDGVVSTTWSPDGRFVLTASKDKTAKIWEAETGTILADLKGHISELTGGCFSPDGKMAVTTSADGTAKLWNVFTGKLLFNLDKHTSYVYEAKFSSDGKWLMTRSWDNTTKIWDTQHGNLLADLTANSPYRVQAYFSLDGNFIYSVFADNRLQILDWKNNNLIKEVSKPGQSDCVSADLSMDGKRMLTVLKNGTINFWDLPSGEFSSTISFTDQPITHTAFSPDGESILVATENFEVMVLKIASGETIAVLKGHKGLINSAAFSPDGAEICTTSWDGFGKIWNASTGKLMHEIEGKFETAQFDYSGEWIVFTSLVYHPEIWTHKGEFIVDLIGFANPIAGANFNNDGSALLIKSSFDVNNVWNIKTGKLLTGVQTDGSETNSSAISPDGTLLSVTTGKPHAEIWDVHTGQLFQELGTGKSPVFATYFSPDSKSLLTFSENNSCKIWNIETGNLMADIKGYNLNHSFAVFSAEGNRFALIHDGNNITIVNATTGQAEMDLIAQPKMINSVEFSADGAHLLSTALDGEAKLWDLGTGNSTASFPNPVAVYSSAKFSPDGKKILTVSDNGALKVWDATAQKELHSFPISFGNIVFGIFSPDGKQIVSVQDDSIVRIWDAVTYQLIRDIQLGFGSWFDDINFTSKLIVAGNNAEARLFSIETGKQLAGLYSFEKEEWAIIYPNGLFDASQGAMHMMYWVKDMEVIELSQMKDGYYQPGLWDLAMHGNTAIEVPNLDDLKMQPDVQLGELIDGILPVILTKRDGGYGKVVVSINNKEVIPDARPANFDPTRQKQSFSVDVSKFIYPGIDNEIIVKAESEDGGLKSRGSKKTVKKKVELSDSKPAFYAIICGTSEYGDKTMNLDFTDDDAKAIAQAMDIGATNLFTKDSVHIFLLSSPGTKLTTKENIRKTFEDISKKAKPEDVVLVYLSGHGISIGGEGKGDFYYLTSDAKSKHAEDYKNAKAREPVTISTEELTQWMNAIPAQKNIMIIDACGSGKAVEKLFTGRGLEASQIKAIDRMSERTGLFIISGCAADAESFESNSLKQGLLTYSILEGIKGAALKENTMDVLAIFNYASHKVPILASQGKLTQEPQMLVPQGGSFPFGIIKEDDRSKIPLATPKPVFVNAYLFDTASYDDPLNLSTIINDTLSYISGNKNEPAEISYIDSDKYPGGCKITGGYSLENNLISFKGFVNCGTLKTPIAIEKKIQDEFVKLIIDQSLKASAKKQKDP